MNPEDIVPSEISQAQKDNYYMIHVHKVSKVKFRKTENTVVITRGSV